MSIKIQVKIEGCQWSKIYISLNENINEIFKKSINETTQNIKQIILKMD